jgi:hypothetical protein
VLQTTARNQADYDPIKPLAPYSPHYDLNCFLILPKLQSTLRDESLRTSKGFRKDHVSAVGVPWMFQTVALSVK